MGTPAKVLAPGDVRRLQARAAHGRYALRNKVMVLLSFKAGLRACEMAGLDWSMVIGTDGKIGSSMLVADGIAKNGRGRHLPIHPDLRSALCGFMPLRSGHAMAPSSNPSAVST